MPLVLPSAGAQGRDSWRRQVFLVGRIALMRTTILAVSKS
jgi:hypothetical protein